MKLVNVITEFEYRENVGLCDMNVDLFDIGRDVIIL